MDTSMIRTLRIFIPMLLLGSSPIWAEEESSAENSDSKEKSEKSDTHTVKEEYFDYVIRLNGTMMPAEAKPIIAAPERFTSLRITSIKPNASYIKKGEPVLTFDLSDLDEQIENYEKAIAEKELELLIAKNELDSLKKLTPIQMAENKRALERAKDDYEYLIKTRIPLNKESIEREVLNAERSLAYNSEELKQLEKMYTDDDLTEETEEIVLKRTRWAVENAEFHLKNAEIDAKRELEVSIPRRVNDAREEVAKREINLARAEVELPTTLEQTELEVAALEKELTDYREALEELKADQKQLSNMTSPIDGIVLYGDWTDTQPPSNVADVQRRLVVGSSFGVHSTIITVVSQTPGSITLSIPENFRSLIGWDGSSESPSGSGRFATLTADPSKAFAVGIESISPTLEANGTYTTVLNIDTQSGIQNENTSLNASPGMNVSVTLVDYEAQEAVVIPPDYLHSKFTDGNLIRYVHRIGEDDTTTETPVSFKRSTKKKVEILSGLNAGDKIAKKPM